MTTKEAFIFLGQVRGCENRIKILKWNIESLRSSLLPGAIRYDKDRVVSSPQDSVEELFDRILAYEKELDSEMKKQATAVLIVDNALQKMEDTKEKAVLADYYIGQISIPQIAHKLKITVRHCYRLRDNGVSMFSEVMTND